MSTTIEGVDADTYKTRIGVLRTVANSPEWKPIGSAVLTTAESFAAELAKRGLPWPYAYPTDVGGLTLEWDAGPWAVSVEFDPAGPVTGDATNVVTGASHDFEVDVAEVVAATLAMLRLAGIAWGEP